MKHLLIVVILSEMYTSWKIRGNPSCINWSHSPELLRNAVIGCKTDPYARSYGP